tara:strand:+ start:742 stop:915 length:174 start_codon:yes stop_codon:yes gene_type:complete
MGNSQAHIFQLKSFTLSTGESDSRSVDYGIGFATYENFELRIANLYNFFASSVIFFS